MREKTSIQKKEKEVFMRVYRNPLKSILSGGKMPEPVKRIRFVIIRNAKGPPG